MRAAGIVRGRGNAVISILYSNTVWCWYASHWNVVVWVCCGVALGGVLHWGVAPSKTLDHWVWQPRRQAVYTGV